MWSKSNTDKAIGWLANIWKSLKNLSFIISIYEEIVKKWLQYRLAPVLPVANLIVGKIYVSLWVAEWYLILWRIDLACQCNILCCYELQAENKRAAWKRCCWCKIQKIILNLEVQITVNNLLQAFVYIPIYNWIQRILLQWDWHWILEKFPSKEKNRQLNYVKINK